MNALLPRLGIVEDNHDLLEELLFFFEGRGYDVWGVPSAEACWRKLLSSPVDIMLIDIGLPGEDGFGVVEYLHNLAGYGLIIISARGGNDDRLRGLGLGADHYHIKPVNLARLVDDIDSLWARMSMGEPARRMTDVAAPGWILDTVTASLVNPDGERLQLTPQELVFLDLLCRNPGEVQSKAHVHERLFGVAMGEAETHRVDVILSRLRRKAVQQRFRLPVRTLFGRGLVFSPPQQDMPVVVRSG